MANGILNPAPVGLTRTVSHVLFVAIAVALAPLTETWFGSTVLAWGLSGGLIGLSAGLLTTPKSLQTWGRVLLGTAVGAVGMAVIMYVIRLVSA